MELEKLTLKDVIEFDPEFRRGYVKYLVWKNRPLPRKLIRDLSPNLRLQLIRMYTMYKNMKVRKKWSIGILSKL